MNLQEIIQCISKAKIDTNDCLIRIFEKDNTYVCMLYTGHDRDDVIRYKLESLKIEIYNDYDYSKSSEFTTEQLKYSTWTPENFMKFWTSRGHIFNDRDIMYPPLVAETITGVKGILKEYNLPYELTEPQFQSLLNASDSHLMNEIFEDTLNLNEQFIEHRDKYPVSRDDMGVQHLLYGIASKMNESDINDYIFNETRGDWEIGDTSDKKTWGYFRKDGSHKKYKKLMNAIESKFDGNICFNHFPSIETMEMVAKELNIKIKE